MHLINGSYKNIPISKENEGQGLNNTYWENKKVLFLEKANLLKEF